MLYTGRPARSPHGCAHPARARPPSHARPGAHERRLRAARRFRPAARVPAQPRDGRAGGQRPRRPAGLRQQQHPLPHRGGHRRMDQGQAVPIRAVYPHRRAVPVGFRLRRRAPPDVLPLAETRALHRLLDHHARRDRARGRPARQGGGGDQGDPGRHRRGRPARGHRLRRDPHDLRTPGGRPAGPRRAAGDAGRPAAQVARRDRAADHGRRDGGRRVPGHHGRTAAGRAGERDRGAGRQAAVRHGLRRRGVDQRGLRRALQPAPAQFLRPHDPAWGAGVLRHHAFLQRVPDLLLPDLQRGQLHPGAARRLRAGQRVDGGRARDDQAGGEHRPGGQALADRAGHRPAGREDRVRPAVRPRARPGAARAPDHQPALLAGCPDGDPAGHGVRAGDLLPGQRRHLRRPAGGRGRRGGRRGRDHHQVPLEGPVCHQPLLRTAAMDEQAALGLYRTMTRIRQFEKRAHDLFLQNLVKGTTHLGTGQEAIAAGVAAAMRPDDYTFVTYRGHNHVLARGTEMTPVMAELLGRQNGLMHGKGGSMHLLDVSRGVLGSYAIIGAQLVIANGTAWSAQYRGTGQVTVCFFGDGATNIGAFHEALNLAVVWALPVVFVCENNQYMEYTAIETVTAVKHPAADRASAYGLAPQLVDGNDVEAVYTMAGDAIEKARQGGGPSLVEALTYRHGGHSRADPGKYRPKEEVAEWLARDPVPAYRQVLISRGVGEAALDRIDAEAKQAVDLATEEAKAGTEPRLELAFTDVWSDGGWDWRN